VNQLQFGKAASSSLNVNHFSNSPSFATQAKEPGLCMTITCQQLSEEERGYAATCEESYDITRQTLALYTQYPSALYVI
jgi:hypothetical protein